MRTVAQLLAVAQLTLVIRAPEPVEPSRGLQVAVQVPDALLSALFSMLMVTQQLWPDAQLAAAVQPPASRAPPEPPRPALPADAPVPAAPLVPPKPLAPAEVPPEPPVPAFPLLPPLPRPSGPASGRGLSPSLSDEHAAAPPTANASTKV